MDNTDNFELELWNSQNEMVVLGSLYKNPEDAFLYIDTIKNADFHDKAMAFYHALLNEYLMTYSSEITQSKMNMFASMNNTRLQGYKKFGCFKTIEDIMSLSVSSSEELKQQVEILKKWSVLRGINASGYDVSRILKHPKFNSLTADECANLIRGNLDKICSNIITGLDEPIDLSSNAASLMDSFLETPERGYQLEWDFLNRVCAGIMLGDSLGILAGSNFGKGRSLIYLCTHLALCENLKIGFIANEMSAESMRLAEITTVLNSPSIQKLHGNQLNITEKRFKTGAYKDDSGNLIYRNMDNEGNYTESVDQFRERIQKTSSEYRGVKDAMQWFEEHGKNSILFKNCAANYTDESLIRTIRSMVLSRSCDIWAYDTLKHSSGSDMSRSSDFVTTTTKLIECNQTLKSAAILTAQMNNSVFQARPEDVNQSSIASGSYIYHLFDQMLVILHLKKEMYDDYVFRKFNSDGSYKDYELNKEKKFTAIPLIKNRRGGKNVYLLETDLDRNIWKEVKNGILVPKEKKKKNDLMW